MSRAREPLPPGPEGPAPAAPTERSLLLSLPREKCDKENIAAGERDITPPSNNQSMQPEIQDQSVWGNHTDSDLIRTSFQPVQSACKQLPYKAMESQSFDVTGPKQDLPISEKMIIPLAVFKASWEKKQVISTFLK